MSNNLDVGMKCIKYMLFTTNFMFVIIGFLLISIGTTVTAVYGDFDLFMEDHYASPSQLLVAIGVIIFFVSIFGCVGAIKESTCLVNTYALLLSLILILEISASIAAYTMRKSMYPAIEDNMNYTITEYYKNKKIQYEWDILQYNVGCCGIHSKNDWANIQYNDTMKDIDSPWTGPQSCCTDPSCNYIYTEGCLERLRFIAEECAYLLGTGAICVAIVQFLGVIFANMLAKSIRRIKTEAEVQRQENRQRLYAQLAMAGKDEKPTPVLYTPTSSDC